MKKLVILLGIMILFIASFNCVVNADSSDYGTVTQISGSPEITSSDEGKNIVVKYSSLNLEWAKAGEGRYKNGWWIGIKVTKPTSAGEATFTRKQYGEDWSASNSFATYKDDDDYINLWAYIDDDILSKNKNTTFTVYEVKFNWDNSADEQTITITIDASDANFANFQLKDSSSSMSKIYVYDSKKTSSNTFTIEKGKSLKDGLTASEKEIFDSYSKKADFVEFYKFNEANYSFDASKIKDYVSNKFDPESEDVINEDAVTIVAYINSKTPVTPTAPAGNSGGQPAPILEEKDNTPKTGNKDLIPYILLITFISAIGIIKLSKKTK